MKCLTPILRSVTLFFDQAHPNSPLISSFDLLAVQFYYVIQKPKQSRRHFPNERQLEKPRFSSKSLHLRQLFFEELFGKGPEWKFGPWAPHTFSVCLYIRPWCFGLVISIGWKLLSSENNFSSMSLLEMMSFLAISKLQ